MVATMISRMIGTSVFSHRTEFSVTTGDDPMASDSKKQQIMADLERLTAEADQLPEGDQRQQLVAKIAKLNVEYQAED